MRKLTPDINELIIIAAEIISSSNHIVVLTGAGSSTPSGIPDFRSADSGLWSRFSPMEVASLTSFRYQPDQFFEWMQPLIRCFIEAEPNPFHIAITELEEEVNVKSIITQNIDGLHQRAGSREVIEVHGSIDTMSCIGCYRIYPSDNYITRYLATGDIPSCPFCAGILKPNVVLFEEQLPIKPWLKAKQEIDSCDLLIVAGSSLTVTPVANLPLKALENNAKVIIVNKSPTYLDSYSDIVFHGDVADIIPAITSVVLDTHIKN